MIKKIWRRSLLFYILQYITAAIKLKSDKSQYGDMFYNGIFGMLAQKYLNVELAKDWIGRLYGVINPNVDIDGNFNPGTTIIEIDGENTNNNEYVKTWIYKQLMLMSSIFSLKDMYEKITIDIRPVGPKEFDNYLIIFDFESRKNKVEWRKKTLLRLLFILCIAAIAVLAITIL